MGGRGSGGSRGGGGASKSINAKTENELNYLLNKSYKYDDDAYEFSRRAASEQAIARKYKQAGKKELAEKYTQYAKEAQAKAEANAVAASMKNDHLPLCNGGDGARAYGEAVGVYLAFVIDKLTDYHSTICSWHSSKELIRNTFGRQAIPMVWDYVEANPFSSSAGCFKNMLEWVTKCMVEFPSSYEAEASQADAQSDCGLRNIMVSTDPPYYDNIGYADL